MERLIRYVVFAAGAAYGVWNDIPPILQLLLALQLLDVAAGLTRAFIERNISSTISFRGFAKKGMALLVVATAAVLESHIAGAVPLTAGTALLYAAHEAISITENAAAVGLPIPNILREALTRLSDRGEQVNG